MFKCCSCKNCFDRNILNFYKNKNSKDGLSSQCRVCAKKYREANKNNVTKYKSSSKEYKKEYYKNNKNKINEIRRNNYSLANKEDIKITNRKRYLKHRHKILQKNSLYYLDNAVNIKRKQREWRSKNILSILLRNRKRQSLLKARSNISTNEIEQLLLKANNECLYCNIPVFKRVNLHLDHKVPLSRGGNHSIENIAISCDKCNLKKGTKTDAEFLSTR